MVTTHWWKSRLPEQMAAQVSYRQTREMAVLASSDVPRRKVMAGMLWLTWIRNGLRCKLGIIDCWRILTRIVHRQTCLAESSSVGGDGPSRPRVIQAGNTVSAPWPMPPVAVLWRMPGPGVTVAGGVVTGSVMSAVISSGRGAYFPFQGSKQGHSL